MKSGKRKGREANTHPVYCKGCNRDQRMAVMGDHRVATVKDLTIISLKKNCKKTESDYAEANDLEHVEKLKWKNLPDGTPIPSSDFCPQCVGRNAGMAKLVNDGGCYITCAKCGLVTAIPAKHKLAEEMHKNNPDTEKINIKWEGCDVQGEMIKDCIAMAEFNERHAKNGGDK